MLIYGAGPSWSYTAMRGFGPSIAPWLWFKLYWAGWAIALVVLARLLWVRGRDTGLRDRLRMARRRLTRSTMRVGTANNDISAIVSKGVFNSDPVTMTRLTDADAWFVKTNAPAGLTCFEREAISFSQDNDFDTKNAKAASYERYVFTWGDWRTVYGSPGA